MIKQISHLHWALKGAFKTLCLRLCLGASGIMFAPMLFAAPLVFTLQSEQGLVTEKSYPNQYLLLSLGFTHCPDICPSTLYEFKLLLNQLHTPHLLQPLFVSIDPQRDTPQTLAKYTQYFDTRIIGLTGQYPQLDQLAKQLGASYGYTHQEQRVKPPNLPKGYGVYHSSLIYLIDLNREIIDVFDYRTSHTQLAETLNALFANAPKSSNPTKSSNEIPAPTSIHASDAPTSACPLPTGFSAIHLDAPLPETLSHLLTTQPTLLHLWASWCAPCIEELPTLNKLAQQLPAERLQLINIGDSQETIAELFNQLHLEHLSSFSTQDSALLSTLGAVGLPYSALSTNQRIIASKHQAIKQTEVASMLAFIHCLNASSTSE